MATTTNYSWTTPDDTDLVKDGASAIRTLGSSIDTTVKDLNPGTTAGDIDYYTSSTAKARIAIGTAGQLLAVNAGATAPEWIAAPAAGGGKVLQVIATFKDNTFTSTAHTFADITGLSATITPSAATSKILILSNINIGGTTAVNGSGARLLRGATAIGVGAAAGDRTPLSISAIVGGDDDYVGSFSFVYLDSPATTSATTYKWQSFEKTGTTFVNRGQADANSDSQFRTASNIILLEIGA